jgi:hypothetical protein
MLCNDKKEDVGIGLVQLEEASEMRHGPYGQLKEPVA